MKFTDGYWQLRPGVEVLRPRDVEDVVVEGDDLLVYAPTVPIGSRGDTLNRPLVTVRLTAPMPDVVGVRISHHLGGVDRGPHFALGQEAHDVAITLPEAPGCSACSSWRNRAARAPTCSASGSRCRD